MKNRFFSSLRVFILLMSLFCLIVPTLATVAQEDELFIASDDLRLSLHVPADWAFTSLPADETADAIYSSILIFAEDQSLLDEAVANFETGAPTSPGASGAVGILNPNALAGSGLTPENALTFLLNAILNTPEDPLTVNFSFQDTISGYPAVIYDVTSPTRDARGYLGGFVTDSGDIVLFNMAATPASLFNVYEDDLAHAGVSISVPAEAGAITARVTPATPEVVAPTVTPEVVPSQEVVVTPEPVPTEEVVVTQETAPTEEAVDPAEIAVYRNPEGRISIAVPGNWVISDLAVQEGFLSYGDSLEALLFRAKSVRPDLAPEEASPVGVGGVVALYDMASLGVDPANPNLQPVMDAVLADLAANGYTAGEPQPITASGVEGLAVFVRGIEVGYIALVPFGDEVAYITGTGVADTFDANADLLWSIVQSVSVPAAPLPTPEPTATPARGLGGLGGLQAAPTATPAGLGGLGGLTGLGGSDATPEATVEATLEATVEATPEVTRDPANLGGDSTPEATEAA